MASASCAGPLPPLGSSPRAGSSPFEAGGAVVAEVPAGVEGFAFAVSVDNPNDTSLRTPAAGVDLSITRAVFGSFGQRVHRAPFHGFENPARTPLRDDGARAPRPRATLVMDRLPRSRGAAGALARRTLAAAGAQAAALRVHLSRPATAMYWPYTGLEVLPAAARFSVWRTASCSLELP
jgi:hypothetical protein